MMVIIIMLVIITIMMVIYMTMMAITLLTAVKAPCLFFIVVVILLMTNDYDDHNVAGDNHNDDGNIHDDDGNHPIDGGGGGLFVLQLLPATSFKVPLVDHDSPQDDCVPGKYFVVIMMVMRIYIVLKALPFSGYRSIYCGSWYIALFFTFCLSTVCLS